MHLSSTVARRVRFAVLSRAGSALVIALAAVLLGSVAAGCKQVPKWERGKKILHYPLRAKVGSLDPVRQSSSYDTLARSQVYETLYTYEYLIRPFKVRPLLAASMPTVSADKRTYTIPLKRGVLFHDDPCFPGGTGREMVARDVIESMMRMADRDTTPGGWWLYKKRIVGFDDFQARMNERPPGAPFDWDADIPGLRAPDPYTVEIELTNPFPQLLYILSMAYTAILPRECAEHYGSEFASRPVGTGPFRLIEWVRGSRLRYERNPTYRRELYPSEASPELEARGLLAPAGQPIPFLDGIVLHVYEQDQPKWLKFRVGDLDLVQVPAEYQQAMYTGADFALRQRFVEEGMGSYNLPLLDFIYRGFNMNDPIVGQGERAKYLRQAIVAALDTGEINKAFYNSAAVLYDGPIPPGLDGHEPGLLSPYRGADGPNLERARELLAKAGYPGGEGLP
ncbi:MAG: ABC transporter substrate-binding protein, partial [Myxococcota bacterium]